MNPRRTRDWGWTRSDCARFSVDALGELIPKSCCSFCPFALSSSAGRVSSIDRYRQEPQDAADALLLEYVARSINPSQTLIVNSSLADLITNAGLTAATSIFRRRLDSCDWSLYEVRRVVRPAKNGGRGMIARALEVVATGTRAAMTEQLAAQPGLRTLGGDGIVRHVVHDRAHGDRVDHWFVAAPTGADSKQLSGFEQWWQQSTGDGLF